MCKKAVRAAAYVLVCAFVFTALRRYAKKPG